MISLRVLATALLLLSGWLPATAQALSAEEFAAMDPERALELPAEEAIGVFGWRRQEYLFVLENALIDLRYLYRAPSGRPSNQLRAAIQAFQRDRGVAPTGKLSVGQFMDLVRRGNEFWQAPVFPGPVHIEASGDRLVAQGSWWPQDGNERDPVQSSSLRCYHNAGLCSLVTAKLLMGEESGGWFHNSAVDLDLHGRDLVVDEWSDDRVIAHDSAMCVAYTLTVDIKGQRVTMESRGTGGDKCESNNASATRQYVLTGGYEVAAPYWEARQARLLKLRSSAFQQLIKRVQQRR